MNKIFDVDDSIFLWMQGLVVKKPILDDILVFLAQDLIYAFPVLMIVMWFWSVQSKKVVFKSVFVSVVAWLGAAKLIAQIVDRPRPTQALLDAKELLFHRPDSSFPSDHATMLFAFALSVRMYGFKKLGNILLVISGLIIISRVFVGVHFPLDVVAGAILGSGIALLFYAIREYVDRYLTEPLIAFMKRLHL